MVVKLYSKNNRLFGRYMSVKKITYKYNPIGEYTNVFLDTGEHTYHLTIYDAVKHEVDIQVEV